MLANGVAVDALDEYLQMLEVSVLYSLKGFCREVLSEFGRKYMGEPTETDLKIILTFNASLGFPRCTSSIDRQHLEMNSCLIAWPEKLREKGNTPAVELGAICESKFWILGVNFVEPESLMDMNVLNTLKSLQKIFVGE